MLASISEVELQRLKPLDCLLLLVVAKATTHKDCPVAPLDIRAARKDSRMTPADWGKNLQRILEGTHIYCLTTYKISSA
jgi:hypothetical protein